MRLLRPKDKAGFIRDEGGMVTHLALVVLILVLLFSGMSLDSSNAWRTRYILQTAADAAAHAASMELPDEDEALEAALELATANLPGSANENAITSGDVVFGNWDSDSSTFTASGTPTNAVRVTATRSSEGANAVPTFFLQLVGQESWNIQVEAIGYRSSEDCNDPDISTNGIFDFSSNSDFYNAFCVEAADGIDLNNNNEFDDDNIIYVDDFDDIDFPGSVSMATIVGRGTASSSATLTYADILEEKSGISAPYVSDIDTLADNYLNPYYEDQPSYINTAAAVITIDADDVKYTSFTPGRIYEVECGGSAGNKAQVYNGAAVSEVVIVSECKFQIGTEAILEDVVLVSRDTSNKSVYAASKVQLGADDGCTDGGGVSIYTAGDFTSASQLEVYGTYISAVGEVQLAAQSDSIEGIAIDANGDVTVSAQAQFGSCKDSSAVEGEVSYLLVR